MIAADLARLLARIEAVTAEARAITAAAEQARTPPRQPASAAGWLTCGRGRQRDRAGRRRCFRGAAGTGDGRDGGGGPLAR